LFLTIESLEDYVCGLAVKISNQEVISIASFNYIFYDPFWTIL
jgi:hypothetical protein